MVTHEAEAGIMKLETLVILLRKHNGETLAAGSLRA